MPHKAPTLLLVLSLTAIHAGPADAAKKEKQPEEDPYAEYVWPPPPDVPRIKLERIIRGRRDVEAKSRLGRWLIGASPQSPYDRLNKPFAVAIDEEGRLLVTDSGTAAVIRFDLDERQMDVLGTKGNVRLALPLGLDIGPDGTIYVADAELHAVAAFGPEGDLRGLFGHRGELQNPTDAAVAPDGERLFVTDSKAHQILVFGLQDGALLDTLGRPGEGEGEFAFPTSLAFGPEGDLYVVDQINSRVQVLDAEGEYLDQFGALGVGFGNFVRPKDVAVDEVGFIYVTDNAFNNVQLFDIDFRLLTYVGSGGSGPGRFRGASGVAVRGDLFAVVDQLGRRLQLFRFIAPKDLAADPPSAF